MESQKALGKHIISHNKCPSWDRYTAFLSLIPNSQGKLSKGRVRSVWSLYIQLVITLNIELQAVRWKAQCDRVNQQETGKGVPLSDCGHFRCQISDPLVWQLFIDSLWKHNGRQGWPQFSISDISSFLYSAAGVLLQIERFSYMKRSWHIEPGSLFFCRKLWSLS